MHAGAAPRPWRTAGSPAATRQPRWPVHRPGPARVSALATAAAARHPTTAGFPEARSAEARGEAGRESPGTGAARRRRWPPHPPPRPPAGRGAASAMPPRLPESERDDAQRWQQGWPWPNGAPPTRGEGRGSAAATTLCSSGRGPSLGRPPCQPANPDSRGARARHCWEDPPMSEPQRPTPSHLGSNRPARQGADRHSADPETLAIHHNASSARGDQIIMTPLPHSRGSGFRP